MPPFHIASRAELGLSGESTVPALSIARRTVSAVARIVVELAGRVRRAPVTLRLRRLEALAAKTPNSIAAVRALASALELAGEHSRAAETYARLALVSARAGDAETASYSARKFELYGLKDPARVYRDLAVRFSAAGRFDDAARSCRRVADCYAADGHAMAVAGYLRALPPLGPHDATTRAELEGIAGIHTAEAPAKDAAAPVRRSADVVVQSGMLGAVTVFDAVQRGEAMALTGRLDVQDGTKWAHLYLKDGRVVSARRGIDRGHVAAGFVFGVRAGAYRLVTTDGVPADEFFVPNNTSLLLDVLREIDDASVAAD